MIQKLYETGEKKIIIKKYKQLYLYSQIGRIRTINANKPLQLIVQDNAAQKLEILS